MTADEQKASVIRCSQEYAKLTQSLVPPVHSRLTTPAENMLFVALDQAESLSFVRLYNYSKTPERGVKEISIRCDGKLVFRGTVSKASVDNQVQKSCPPGQHDVEDDRSLMRAFLPIAATSHRVDRLFCSPTTLASSRRRKSLFRTVVARSRMYCASTSARYMQHRASTTYANLVVNFFHLLNGLVTIGQSSFASHVLQARPHCARSANRCYNAP